METITPTPADVAIDSWMARPWNVMIMFDRMPPPIPISDADNPMVKPYGSARRRRGVRPLQFEVSDLTG